MIRVQTDPGPVEIDADAKEVSNSGGHLSITQNGTVTASFKVWTHWHTIAEQEGTTK